MKILPQETLLTSLPLLHADRSFQAPWCAVYVQIYTVIIEISSRKLKNLLFRTCSYVYNKGNSSLNLKELANGLSTTDITNSDSEGPEMATAPSECKILCAYYLSFKKKIPGKNDHITWWKCLVSTLKRVITLSAYVPNEESVIQTHTLLIFELEHVDQYLVQD
jgi:hypothetical protein